MDAQLWLNGSHLRLLGWSLLVIGVPVAVAMSFLGPRKPEEGKLPRGFKAPMVALELPRDGAEVRAILEVSGGPDKMKNGLLLDLGIILLYGSVLAALGVLLCQNAVPAAGRIAGLAAALAGVTAGLLDVLENVLMWKVIDGARDGASLQVLTRAALGKWGLLAVSFLLLGGLFLLGTPMARVLAGLCLVTAFVGLAGLARHPLLEWAVNLMGGTILVALLTFALRPESLRL